MCRPPPKMTPIHTVHEWICHHHNTEVQEKATIIDLLATHDNTKLQRFQKRMLYTFKSLVLT